MHLLTSYINDFANIKALVIGDIMLDKFEYGKVNRISPEAPVPVFRFDHEKVMLGGAGNVVANLISLGCQTTYIGIVGKDINGERIASLLQNIGAHGHLLKLKNYKTIVKTRLIAGNNHLLRADTEEMLPIVNELLPKFKKILYKAVSQADVILVSDYNKGLLTPVTTNMIIDICNELGKKIIVDPKGSDYSKYIGATLVKPNLKEFSEATGYSYNPADDNFHDLAVKGAEYLFSKYNIQNLIITLSEYGMLYIAADRPQDLLHIPTEAKEVFDVSGAGDTALATLGAAIGANVPIKDSMKLANLASGIVVGKLGTATVSSEELKNAVSVNGNNGWPQKKKIITLPQAEHIVKLLKEDGKVVGFTNGCFDCCHLGHIASFMQAKNLCDVLIVAVNSDGSIRKNKGPDRPIQDEKTRSLLLASLEFIDYVILFDETSPIQIVQTLQPDVIAKEGYSIDKWPEAQLVQSYGGKAVILKHIDGYSTTNLISRMKGL